MIARKSARLRKVIDGTPGGKTYIVKIPGEKLEKAICFRPLHHQEGMRCTNPAGYGTWHPGEGACKFHGGATENNGRISTGRTAKAARQRLAGDIQKYLDKDRSELLDLSYELAATKAIFDEFLDTYPDLNAMDEDSIGEYNKWIYRYQAMIQTLGGLVDKASRMENRNTLTAAQVLYLRATVADILMKYIKDPSDRDRAAKELAMRMGGDVEEDVEMRRSEFALPKGAEL